MTLQPLFVKLSQNTEGNIEYSSSSAVLLMELLKITISFCMLLSDSKLQAVRPGGWVLLQYAMPAFVYFVNNNITFLILSNLNATTFQLLGQLKTIFTAILFRLVLGCQLGYYQYLAIWQLACGMAVSQISSASESRPGHSSALGVALMVFSCALSSLGGIYNEKLLKDRAKESIHWQNVFMYSWGIVFNMVTFLYFDLDSLMTSGMFKGYNIWTGAVIVNNALNGLAISALLKYADNIARIYANAAAMLLTMICSVILFGERLSPQLLLAICVVSASAVQYNVRPEQLGFHEVSDIRSRRPVEDAQAEKSKINGESHKTS